MKVQSRLAINYLVLQCEALKIDLDELCQSTIKGQVYYLMVKAMDKSTCGQSMVDLWKRSESQLDAICHGEYIKDTKI